MISKLNFVCQFHIDTLETENRWPWCEEIDT